MKTCDGEDERIQTEIQLLLSLGPGNSFFLPMVLFSSLCWLCLASPAAEICLVETSTPHLRTACQGPPSELDRVLNPRNWILQMGKLSHCQGDNVPAATHPSSGASTLLPGHWTPKAAIRPLMVCPEPSLSCLGSKPQKRALTLSPTQLRPTICGYEPSPTDPVPQSCCPGGCLSFPGSAALPPAPSCSLAWLRAVRPRDVVLLVTGDCPQDWVNTTPCADNQKQQDKG